MDRNGMRPIHPGEVLDKEFMEPLGMTVMDLAMPTNWPEAEIEKLVKCQLRICADLAMAMPASALSSALMLFSVSRSLALATASRECLR